MEVNIVTDKSRRNNIVKLLILIERKQYEITEELLKVVLEKHCTQEKLTPSELRLLFQLLAGSNIREAAEFDNVSVETKRSHYKSIARKINIRTRSSLVGKLAFSLVFELLAANERP